MRTKTFTTDADRLKSGKKRYELRDEKGVLIDYVYRCHQWQANRVFRYHIQRIKQQRERHRKDCEYINNLLERHRKELVNEQLRQQRRKGLENLDKMTLFELHDLLD